MSLACHENRGNRRILSVSVSVSVFVSVFVSISVPVSVSERTPGQTEDEQKQVLTIPPLYWIFTTE